MRSTVSGHSIFIDAGDAIWFWQDARNVAANWSVFEDLVEDDRALLDRLDNQGRGTVPGSAYSHAFDRLEAAGLIVTSTHVRDTVEVEITLCWGGGTCVGGASENGCGG